MLGNAKRIIVFEKSLAMGIRGGLALRVPWAASAKTFALGLNGQIDYSSVSRSGKPSPTEAN